MKKVNIKAAIRQGGSIASCVSQNLDNLISEQRKKRFKQIKEKEAWLRNITEQ